VRHYISESGPVFGVTLTWNFHQLGNQVVLRTNAACTALVKNSMKIDNNRRKMYELSQNKAISENMALVIL